MRVRSGLLRKLNNLVRMAFLWQLNWCVQVHLRTFVYCSNRQSVSATASVAAERPHPRTSPIALVCRRKNASQEVSDVANP
jgi:hypothetical protein